MNQTELNQEAAHQNEAECERLLQLQAVAKRLEQMRSGLRADKAQQRLTKAVLSEAKEEEGRGTGKARGFASENCHKDESRGQRA